MAKLTVVRTSILPAEADRQLDVMYVIPSTVSKHVHLHYQGSNGDKIARTVDKADVEMLLVNTIDDDLVIDETVAADTPVVLDTQNWKAKDALGNVTTYAALQVKAADGTNGSEDGQIIFKPIVAGTVKDELTIGAGVMVGAATGGLKGDGTLNLAGALYSAGNQVVGARATGWAADTGTAKRTANATYSATAGGAYDQTVTQTLMDAVKDLSQTVKAMKDDLISHGLYGA